MICLSTIGDLIGTGTGLTGWCDACGAFRALDMEALAARYGRGASYIKSESPIRIRCRDCGARGDYQLATPCSHI